MNANVCWYQVYEEYFYVDIATAPDCGMNHMQRKVNPKTTENGTMNLFDCLGERNFFTINHSTEYGRWQPTKHIEILSRPFSTKFSVLDEHKQSTTRICHATDLRHFGAQHMVRRHCDNLANLWSFVIFHIFTLTTSNTA